MSSTLPRRPRHVGTARALRAKAGGALRQSAAVVVATPAQKGRRYYAVSLATEDGWELQSTHLGRTKGEQTMAKAESFLAGNALARFERFVRVTWGRSHAAMTRPLYLWQDGKLTRQ